MMDQDAIRAWNEFIFAMIDAEKAWERYCKERTILGFDPHQLMARMNARSKFHVMLPNFIRYTNTRGGIRAMFVPEPVPQKREGLLYREF